MVCGRVKDVIIMAGRNIYPTDIERAASRVDGVRPGYAVAVRLDAGMSRESFSVAVESKSYEDRSRCDASSTTSPTKWSPMSVCVPATSSCSDPG